MLLFLAPTEGVWWATRSHLLQGHPTGSPSMVRAEQQARAPLPPPGELALLDTAARGGPQAQKAGRWPALNTKLIWALPHSTNQYPHGRHDEAPWCTYPQMRLSGTPGATSLHHDTHLQPAGLRHAKLPHDTTECSLDYNCLESISAFSIQTYFHFNGISRG